MTANIRHSSENSEFATPIWLVEKARIVLDGIDLDPASSERVNQDVKATTIYTIETNGLLQPRWLGKTSLNPPGGLVDDQGHAVHRSTNKNPGGCVVTGSCGLPPSPNSDGSGVPAGHSHSGVTSSAVVWWRVLCKQWELGNVSAGFFVSFSLELLQSCQPGPHPLDFPCCIPSERIKFDAILPDGSRVSGKQPTHANVLVLLPPQTGDAMIARFINEFAAVGKMHVPQRFSKLGAQITRIYAAGDALYDALEKEQALEKGLADNWHKACEEAP